MRSRALDVAVVVAAVFGIWLGVTVFAMLSA